MPIKVLLDTDIGSDIDDAVCLAYLLAQPRCELLGITTVSGQPVERAMIASAICKVAGKDVPIYPGCDTPFIIPQQQPIAQHAPTLSKWPHETEFPHGQAVEFLRQTIRKYPGEVTLLAIGPLTNVALLFKVDPEIPALLKSLVLMCGAFSDDHIAPESRQRGRREWNALLDPVATEIVYRAAAQVPQHRSMGLDVTLKVALDSAQVKEQFSKYKLLHPVMDFSEEWFQRARFMHFHDPLAAMTIFEDDVCGFVRGDVTVELKDEKLAGKTDFAPNANGRHEIALEVDPARCFEAYFKVF